MDRTLSRMVAIWYDKDRTQTAGKKSTARIGRSYFLLFFKDLVEGNGTVKCEVILLD